MTRRALTDGYTAICLQDASKRSGYIHRFSMTPTPPSKKGKNMLNKFFFLCSHFFLFLIPRTGSEIIPLQTTLDLCLTYIKHHECNWPPNHIKSIFGSVHIFVKVLENVVITAELSASFFFSPAANTKPISKADTMWKCPNAIMM